MQEILRKCTKCGLKVFTEDQRQLLFVKDNAQSKEKFGYTKSVCKKCNALNANMKRKGLSFYGPNLIKRCRDCGIFPNSVEQLEILFIKDKTIKNGYGSLCKKCRNARQYQHNNKRRNYIKSRGRKNQILSYGISIEQYENFLQKQNNCCAICFNSFINEKKHPSIDHDHSCCSDKKSCGNCVRGLICNRCNLMIGLAKDDTIILQNAIKYLRR